MQFGFMKGKGTTYAIFIVRQMQEKFRAKGKKLYFGFVNLEKSCVCSFLSNISAKNYQNWFVYVRQNKIVAFLVTVYCCIALFN